MSDGEETKYFNCHLICEMFNNRHASLWPLQSHRCIRSNWYWQSECDILTSPTSSFKFVCSLTCMFVLSSRIMSFCAICLSRSRWQITVLKGASEWPSNPSLTSLYQLTITISEVNGDICKQIFYLLETASKSEVNKATKISSPAIFLTILVRTMNDMENGINTWKYHRTQLWMRYCNSSVSLPPPMNIIDILITLPARFIR